VTADYTTAAEFYDLVAQPFRESQTAALRAALRHADPSAGPLLDLGAGTGAPTLDILEALPTATVIAVEPARAMRTVLLSRFAVRPDLAERVTVLPGELDAARLPDTVGGVVALSMLGHLDRGQRAALFQTLAAHLRPGLPLIADLPAPETPAPVPLTCFAAGLRLGAHEYQGWCQATPAGGETMSWTTTYRTLRDGVVIDERVARNDFHHFGAEQLAAEAAAAGYSYEPAMDPCIILRRT
jgi:SAM-dependent methyltransferase